MFSGQYHKEFSLLNYGHKNKFGDLFGIKQEEETGFQLTYWSKT